MNLRTKLTAAATALLLAAPAVTASAFPIIGKKKPTQTTDLHKPTASQNALLDKAMTRETAVIKTLKERTPLVETYIQNMRPDVVIGQTPDSDWHALGRVDFGKVINDQGYGTDKREEGKKGKFGLGALKGSLGYITGLSASLHLQYHESGFVQMLLIDSKDFNRNTYRFGYVRNDFLGTIPTVVFDVIPVKKNATGRFHGRIWVERNNGNIVRFNGEFAGSDSQEIKEFFHFDSWRTNVQEGLWLPTSVYVEETDPKSPTHSLKFKAVNHIWGYALKVPESNADLTDVQVVGANDESAQAQDVSPLQAQREWVQQAEDNVITRLFQAGLIDAPSDFDKTLSDLANNILIYNNIQTSRPLKVRTLLTEPLESLAVGNTILLSKSLIDTAVPTQDGAQLLGNLNCLLAFQVAHIILGHHIDTKYAFNDRLLFPDEAAFHRLPMQHTDEDDAAAAKKAMDLLGVKDLADSQQYMGLYLQQLQIRLKGLKALNTPQIGDSLVKPDGTFWMQALVGKGSKLDQKDLKQQAAMPLGQFLKFDPWTDQVIQMHVAYEPLLNPYDKMPFEVTPVYLKLSYFVAPAAPAAAPPAAAGAAAPAAGDATTAAAPAADAGTAGTAPAGTAPADAGGATCRPGCRNRHHGSGHHGHSNTATVNGLLVLSPGPMHSGPKRRRTTDRGVSPGDSMMKFRSCLLLLGLAAGGSLAYGQALPAATQPGQLQVGIGYSYGDTDLFPRDVAGATVYATFDLGEHLGAEADAHLMLIKTPDDFVEDSYLLGPRYAWHFGRYDPYVKVLVGIGTTSVVDNRQPVVHTPGTYFAFGMGGGVDIRLPHHLNARLDFERQDWPGFPDHGLTPTLATVGIAYRFR